jgi:hypothetical protein
VAATPHINQVLQLREGGEIPGRVGTHGRPCACAPGGDNDEQLYITSSETDDPEEPSSSAVAVSKEWRLKQTNPACKSTPGFGAVRCEPRP